jgi:hypothetical protein
MALVELTITDLPGVVTPVELTAFFQESEVTVLPSPNSTNPSNGVVESLACDTLVVATDHRMRPVKLTGSGPIMVAVQSAGQAILQILET